MVRPLALVAVRQQHDERGALAPLLLRRRDELVDDGLGAVDEVAELRLPEHQGVRALHRVAVLEAEGGVLAERGVVHPELRLVARQVQERSPLGTGVAVVQHGVALDEGAAARVLPGEAHRGALHEQRPEGDQLAEAPVDAALLRHELALLQHLGELGVHREALGRRHLDGADALEHGVRDGGLPADHVAGTLPLRLRALQAEDLVVAVGRGGLARRLGLGEDPLELGLVVLQRLLGLLDRDVAARHEVLRVQLAHRLLGLDEVVHQRLRHRRVVALVVATTAVADHVDDDVAVELLAVGEGQLGDAHAGLGVVAVHVEDGDLVALGDVGRVGRGARRRRTGGEAHLVVDDHVDRAAGAVPAQLREVEHLGHDALAGERGVAVDEDRQHGEAVAAQVDAVLLGPHDALEHRVDRLEVRRVGRQVHLRGGAGLGREHALGAEVVLHVAGALHALRVELALELLEDLAVALARDVGQHVEAAAVRHADADLVEPALGGARQDGVEQRDDRLAALEREPLLADVLGLQEGLERLGRVQLAQDAQLVLARGAGVARLEPLLEPLALGGVGDVHVLDADGAAVRVAQQAEDVAQRVLRLAAEAARGEPAVQVPQRHAVVLDVQVGVLALAVGERVGLRHEVAARAVGVDELRDTGRLGGLDVGVHGVVAHPAHGLVRHAQGREHAVVEAVQAEQLVGEHLEELAGLRALDDAVVVGRRDRHDLRDAHAGELLLGRARELRGVVHGADADDRALAGHEARHGVHGADAARVGQADRGALEVRHAQLVVAGLADQVLVAAPELVEVHLVGLLDGGHDQLTGAVGLGEVDRQTEVHVFGLGDAGLAVDLHVGVVHLGHGLEGLDHGVADEVGEGDLPTAAAPEMVVDDDAVVEQQLDRHRAHARRGGHGQARLHVGRGTGGCATQPLLLDLECIVGALGCWGRGGLLLGRGGRGLLGLRLSGRSASTLPAGRIRGLVVREEVPPSLVNRIRVGEVLLVKLLDQPLVRAEICQGLRRLRRHGGDRPLPQLACEC